MDPTFIAIAIFVFLVGACVGSFLNVVVYRMPRDESIVHPPSKCPKCGHKLAAFDNVPIFGWLWLRGKCRYCGNPISARYPIVELITALLFLAHFLLLFKFGWGPYETFQVNLGLGLTATSFRPLTLENDWPILLLHLCLIGALLAASLIDLEHFIIPLEICWFLGIVGVVVHALLVPPGALGSLHMNPLLDAMALGGGLGLLLSLALLWKGLIPRSMAEDEPMLEKDLALLPEDQRPDNWPPARIRREMGKEMLFLLPPIVLACVAAALVMKFPAINEAWTRVADQKHVSGALGAVMGGLVGGFIVWFFRVAGSYGFGREAMGMGDVHLMLGVGAVLGAPAAAIIFFVAPIFGLVVALVQLVSNGRRELPYGPYLSLGTYAVMLFYRPIADYLWPGVEGLLMLFRGEI